MRGGKLQYTLNDMESVVLQEAKSPSSEGGSLPQYAADTLEQMTRFRPSAASKKTRGISRWNVRRIRPNDED